LYRLADLPQQLGRLRPAQSFRAAMERSLYNLQRIYQAAYRRTKAG
jgi:hypothetical protein